MTFRQLNSNIINDFLKIRSIEGVAKHFSISEELISAVLFTHGLIDENRVDLKLDEPVSIVDAFGYEGPEAISIRIEIEFGKLSSKDKRILEKYGKAKDARIYRDVIVPPNFTLHQLNYVIQQAFGWQNYHLHCFNMEQKDFKKITKDKFKNWCDLCGIYFRYPDGDDSDIFWDDDYTGETNLKEYFASKYTGDYEYGALGDYYLENQLKVKDFNDKNRMLPLRPNFSFKASTEDENQIETIIPLKSSIKQLKQSRIIFEGKFETLIESLKLSDILVAKGRPIPDYSIFKNEMIKDVILENKKFFNQELETFSNVRKNFFAVIDERDEMEKAIERKEFDAVTVWRDKVDKVSEEYQRIVDNTQPPVMPVTDKINYEYDFGDDWQVSITSLESYYDDSVYYKDDSNKEVTDKLVFHDSEGNVVADDLVKKIISTIVNKKPTCINVNGVNMIDDAGGVYGFIRMLRELNEPTNKEEEENMKVWAYELMNWNSKVSKPDTLL